MTDGTPAGATKTVLVVEDEEIVRHLCRRALEEHGYRVVEAANGRSALDLLMADPGDVDLVLCDLVMPQMNGNELAWQLAQRAIHPAILYMSGYTGDDVVYRGLLQPDAPFMQKPFSPAELCQQVRHLLDQVPGQA